MKHLLGIIGVSMCLILMGTSAIAQTAGPNFPGTGTNSGVTGPAWSNPGNITANDNAYATVTDFFSTSLFLNATTFGFAIPTDATITGIQVTIGRFRGGIFLSDNSVRLLKAGVEVGDNKAAATNWPTSEAVANYGGTSDLWGTTWTPADINDSGFGVALSVNIIIASANVDYMTITVTYSTNYYRSLATGTWTSTSTWQQSADGITWGPASSYPGQNLVTTSALIRNDHTVTLNVSPANSIKALTVGEGASGILNMNGTASTNRTLSVSGNLTIASGGTIRPNNQTGTNSHTLNVGGNFTNNGTFTATDGNDAINVNLNGTVAAQTAGGSAGITFNNLTINSLLGVTLGANATVVGTLNLTGGVLTTGGNMVIVTNTAPGAVVITGGSIAGTIRRTPSIAGTYWFTDFYTYMLLNGSQSGKEITMTCTPGEFPSPIANQSAAIKRHYFIEAPASLFVDSLYLAFIDGPLNENPNNIPAVDIAVFRLRTGTTSWHNYGPFGGTLQRGVAGDVSDWNTKFAIGDGTQALPVQLASFTGAVVAGNNVRLDWRTISEVNNYGFYVQRRNMGATEWTEIPGSFVPGHGTTNEPRNYTYTDNTGITTATQYRLKQVDLDGTQHFTEPILVDLPTSVPEVAPKVFALSQNYPNPFNPSTEIKFTVEVTGRATLDVYNSIGQKVATLFDGIAEAGQFNTVRFNATGLASGVYFYRLVSGQKSDLKKLMLLK